MPDMNSIKLMIDAGMVLSRQHPFLPLSIYNYTHKCQKERMWNPVTKQCRGLIMENDAVVARPFEKFFNDTEMQQCQIPWHLDHEITAKMDGSLVIMFHYRDAWHFATRGSFTSWQAAACEKLIAETYNGYPIYHYPDVTYLYEFISPRNQIVVKYPADDAILLAMIHTDTGEELSWDQAPPKSKIVERLPQDSDPTQLRKMINPNEEGYVVKFANGLRIKIKGDDYIRKHAMISHLSSRHIWKVLSAGGNLNDIILPGLGDYSSWAEKEAGVQISGWKDMMSKARMAIDGLDANSSRKEKAIHIMANHREIAPLIFAALDGKPMDPIAWKLLYPELRKPEFISPESE